MDGFWDLLLGYPQGGVTPLCEILNTNGCIETFPQSSPPPKTQWDIDCDNKSNLLSTSIFVFLEGRLRGEDLGRQTVRTKEDLFLISLIAWSGWERALLIIKLLLQNTSLCKTLIYPKFIHISTLYSFGHFAPAWNKIILLGLWNLPDQWLSKHVQY